MIWLWLPIAVLGTLLSSFGVARCRQWIIRRDIVDIPNERSSHSQPTPRGGGLAIVLITLVVWLAYGWLWPTQGLTWCLAWAGAAIVATVGWIDDVHNLSSKLRLGIHTLVAVLAILGVGAWDTSFIPLVGSLQLGLLGYSLTALWIIGLINAYNFMDGIDGMAGLQALLAGSTWFVIGLVDTAPHIAGLGLILGVASLGFLLHNWHPATVFMGDVASGFLGYMFAVLPLLLAKGNAHDDALLMGILVVWPFLFDTILTFIRRLRNGEDVFAAHRSHLYQRLIISGMSHPAVSCLYGGLTLVGVLLALLMQDRPAAGLIAPFIIAACSALLYLFVRKQEAKHRAVAQ